MERGLVGELGGKELKVREVAFDGGEKQYAGYTAHSQLRLELVDSDGKELSLETGSIAEVRKRFKFLSFMRD